MSRIGKRKLIVPQGVEVTVVDRETFVKGPKGTLKVEVPMGIVVKVEDSTVTTTSIDKGKEKFLSALLGLTNSLVNNALIGVSSGFSKKLELSGVGYRAKKNDTVLSLALGFSHPIEYEIPSEVSIEVEDNTKIVVSGIDKQLVGAVCAKIRNFRKPEPYKGKGIKYSDEVVNRKPGKAGKVQK